MAADKMKEILKHFPDLEDGWKEMKEKLKAEPAEMEMLSLKYREMLQRESPKESLVESEFTKAKRADSDLKVMKANEAPEKLYIPFEDEIDRDCLNTYAQKNTYHKEIEYTRTNAFIEKALVYLHDKFYFNNVFYGVVSTDFNAMEEMYDDFKNYMKGENE